MTTLDRDMSVTPPVGVGLIGSSQASRFFCERLSLRSDLRLVAAGFEEGSSTAVLGEYGDHFAGTDRTTEPQTLSTARDVWEAPDVRVVFFARGSSSGAMLSALARSKSILVEAPQMLTSNELEELAKAADCHKQVAAIYEPRRWDRDFMQARSLLESGRLGRLLRLRYAVHDSGLPGELFPLGIANELGSHVLDQMLQLVGPNALRSPDGRKAVALWRHFPSALDHSEGFVVSFEFAENVSAVLEIHTQSLLGYRSGWMLEGTEGAYRNGCLYTRTSDGEIVDEPLSAPTVSSDPFLDAVSDTLRGHCADLPTVRDAIRVAALLFNRSDSIKA